MAWAISDPRATAALPAPSTRRFALWRRLMRELSDRYRPERHYMRGPGPKWHAKHGGGRDAAAVRVSRPR
jgi:hypothetical protein